MVLTLMLSMVLPLSADVSSGSDVVRPAAKFELIIEHNPPHNYYDEASQEYKGASVDVVKALMKEAGMPYEMSVMPWRRGYRKAMATPNTCLFGMNKTKSRVDDFRWVGPVEEGGWAFFSRPDSDFKITKLEDLLSYKIVATENNATTATLRKAGDYQIVASAKASLAVKLLYHRRVDFWLSGLNDAPLIAARAGMPEPKLVFQWTKASLYMGCAKSTAPALIDRLNQLNDKRLTIMHGVKG